MANTELSGDIQRHEVEPAKAIERAPEHLQRLLERRPQDAGTKEVLEHTTSEWEQGKFEGPWHVYRDDQGNTINNYQQSKKNTIWEPKRLMDGIKQHPGPYRYTIKIMNFALARSLPLARSRCSSCDFLLIFNPGAPMGPIGPQWGPMGPRA